jgi:hypothetical protein
MWKLFHLFLVCGNETDSSPLLLGRKNVLKRKKGGNSGCLGKSGGPWV